MKVLFVLRHVAYFRFFDRLIRELCASGHNVTLLLEHRHRTDDQADRSKESPRALLACQAEVNNFDWDWAIQRRDVWRKPTRAARELINYASYLKPGRQSSRMIVERSARQLPLLAQRLLRFQFARTLLVAPLAQEALRSFERLAPPDRGLVGWLRLHQPDVVVASPVIMRHSEEVEYIKAAKAVGIPTLVAVTSWDHLTTKGVFQLIPDLTLVWNQAQVEEAVRLHGVPLSKVVFTGAPVFDEWFQMQPTLDRAAFCRLAGLDPARPYVLYLCSSQSIVRDETETVEGFAWALQQHAGTGPVSLLVRPYPWHASIWQNYTGDRFAIWPRAGNNPDTPEARQDYYHALRYSAAVAGINTSGFIDAAIVGRPCLTILSQRYRDTQQDIAHFQHLLKADFLEAARGPAGAAELLSTILEGRDARSDNRQRFVREFVRPWGIDQPASQVMARAIEAAAARQTADQLNTLLAASSAPAPAGIVTPLRAAGAVHDPA
jgi:hypothetical protein